mgnify:CR=1 FL=1
MDYNNTAILATNAEHAKKIIQFYGNKQYNITGYSGNISVPTFYGVISDKFSIYNNSDMASSNIKIIELPLEYPKVMMVNNGGDVWAKRVVFMEKNNKYITWVDAETLEDAERTCNTLTWSYAKEVEEETTEITIEEIAKLLNKPKHLIKIVDK